jgi:hypothetical protein
MNCGEETFSEATPAAFRFSNNDNGSGERGISCGMRTKEGPDKGWSSAQERVLLYLKALDVPAVEALKLALKALKQASSQTAQSSEIDHTAAAIKALRDLLQGKEASSEEDDGKYPLRSWAFIPAESEKDPLGNGSEIVASPPLNRGSMVPGEFDRKPWRSFFAKIFNSRKKASVKPIPKSALHAG